MAINKEQAIKLRSQGFTYKQIAEELGCSVDWCKRNLSKVPKNTQSIDAYELCKQKAQTKEGITNGEIQQTIRMCYPELCTNNDYKQIEPIYKRIRRKLAQDKDCVIRPYWMVPNMAQTSLEALLLAINTIEARLHEEVDMVRQQLNLDSSYKRSILYSLISMTSAGCLLHGKPIESLIDGLQSTIDKLESKNQENTPTTPCILLLPESVFNKSVNIHLSEYTEKEGVFVDDVQEYDMPDELPIEAYL